mmetsp:Transcript_28170/g.91304  ORF Transcript_28170/g.91304 Transcript_28170/m.91304 type:complete len:280 (-) Transcript_28170:1355-2194(-)
MSLKIRPLFEILQEGVAKNAMNARTTALQAAEAAPAASSGSVSFPNDYPNSVKHFLLIGSLGMFLGACVFLYLSLTRAKSSLAHTLIFLAAAIASMAYYAMWTGIGVELKTTDLSPRVIFLSRYVDALLTQPLILTTLCLINKADNSILVSLVGNDILMVLAAFIGSLNVAPLKYMWWFASFIFLVLVVVQLVQKLEGANDVYKILTYITIASSCIYSIVWLLGSEGTAALGLTQEVGLITLTDLVSKLGFGLYFLFNYDAAMGEDDTDAQNQQSQQYV